MSDVIPFPPRAGPPVEPAPFRSETLAEHLKSRLVGSESAYLRSGTSLVGPLTSPSPTSVALKIRVLTMRLSFIVSELSRDYSVGADFLPGDAVGNLGAPTALLITRRGDHRLVPILVTQNIMMIGPILISLRAPDAGERAVDTVVEHVAAFFEGRPLPKAVVQ